MKQRKIALGPGAASLILIIVALIPKKRHR